MSSTVALAPPPEFVAVVENAWTAPFWKAASEGRLVAARCHACGHFRMPPTPFCPECLSQEIDWIDLKGEGTVYTFTIVRHAVIPDLKKSVPYVPAVVELPDAGGARLVGNVVSIDPDKVYIGMAVRVTWGLGNDGYHVPLFEPV